jgi:hypothetical protein
MIAGEQAGPPAASWVKFAVSRGHDKPGPRKGEGGGILFAERRTD